MLNFNHPKDRKNLFFTTFGLSLVLGLALFFFVAKPAALALNINVSACVPKTEVCNNNADDDCDGLVDCNDSGCTSNPICSGSAVCGNGILETGEQCESSSSCSSGYFCNGSCQCQQIPGGCGDTTCDGWGACLSGQQVRTCQNNCGSWPDTRPCTVPMCGDSHRDIELGEECDGLDNVGPHQRCSGTCTLINLTYCGDGVKQTPNDDGLAEQCDDGNQLAGDCCSVNCQPELLIKNVFSAVTDQTATISWQTPCQSTNSVLDWGRTITLSDGSISLSGQNYSYTITDLTPNTVYFYQITATVGAWQTIHTDSLVTAGGTENCTNGLDDNHNGLCDYPASTCTDGSVSGDPACACTPNFQCTYGLCQADNKWLVTCVDQTIPKCQSDYSQTETCQACPGLICGLCQVKNETNCSCTTTPNCCGNNICEPPAETPVNCLADCPAICISSWQCDDWTPAVCPASNIQTRNCWDICEIHTTPSPPTQQTCGGQCPDLTCGLCQQVDFNQCSCQNLAPCCGNLICENGETHESCSQDCVQSCLPNWTCTTWGGCQNGIQTRECNNLNTECDLDLDRPPETRSCQPGCDVACGTCQNINLTNCQCDAVSPCCGNRICESPETIWSCPVDCGIPPNVIITLPQCLDGLDNDNDGLVDYPADPDCQKPSGDSELGLLEILNNISQLILKNILDNPAVEQINKTLAAPALIAVIVVNTFSAFSIFNLLSYLRYLFSQPIAVLFRRKRKKWGLVYNSLTKQPVDLAIVRLYQQDTGRLLQSRVTDRQGRYNFLVASGHYYLVVVKPNYGFPSEILKDKKEDVKYLDLYHGEMIEVSEKNVVITANIPLDPKEDVRPAKKIIIQYYLRKIQYALAFSAVPLAAVSVIISPEPLTFALLGFHCLLFILFRRLSYQRPPKSWGIVYDKNNRAPIGLAITRIYDKKYNKLLETRVTDARGRYAFLVDNNVYYLTAEKAGYQPEKISEIDLVNKNRETVVNLDIGLGKGQGAVTSGSTEVKPAEPAVTPTPLPPNPMVDKILPPAIPQSPAEGVSRETLTELLQRKKSEALAPLPTESEVAKAFTTQLTAETGKAKLEELPKPQAVSSDNKPTPAIQPADNLPPAVLAPDKPKPEIPKDNIFG